MCSKIRKKCNLGKAKINIFCGEKIPKEAALKFISAFEFGGNHIQIGYCTFSHF